jgi:hypothetical protein
MALNQNPKFHADKVAAMKAAHAEYSRIKAELLLPIVKTTSGKQNTLDTASAASWLPFGQDNPKKITDKVDPEAFADKLDADELVVIIEKMESEEQNVSKIYRDIVSSDIRFYWTNLENYYLAAAVDDAIIKAKYKDLPSISPTRKSDTEIQNAFDKLEAKRKKKQGGDSTKPTI